MSERPAALDLQQAIDDQLAVVIQSSTADLQKAWRRAKRCAPPQGLSRDLLIRALAYDIQEHAFGTMPKATLRRLKTLAGPNVGTDQPTSAAPSPKSGTRLVRDWGGATHTVLVLDDGFDYGGQRYTSLSKIAEVISGHHRSGPAFFGLKRRGPRFVASATPVIDDGAP
jgi:Protein of unknown function (DUF2924)